MKRYLKCCLIAVLLCCSVLMCGCKAKKDDLEHIGQGLTNYYMDIEYDDRNKSLYSKQTVEYANNSNAILKEVYFHLYVASFCKDAKNRPVEDMYKAKAFPNGENFASLNIIRVKLNDQDIVPCYEGEDNDIMKIELSHHLEPTEKAKIYIEYQITIPNMIHRFGFTGQGVNLSNFYPIACVYDENGWSKNPYHFNGDPFYSDMANYYVNFACDKSLICAFSGESSCVIDDDIAYYTVNNMCVRDFAVMLSKDFKILSKTENEITFNYYYLNDNSPEKSLKCAIDSIDIFSELFYPYPYNIYNVVQSDFLYGGMEYPMLSLISADIDDYDEHLNVIIHETAHQWWYHLVGNDQFNNPWLDEALTEFSTLLFYDNVKGYNLNHNDMISGMQENYKLFTTVYKDVLGEVDTSMNRKVCDYATSPEYTYCVYVKGTLMFDSLYQLVGKKAFVQSLQLYVKTYAYKISTPECLIYCFEKECKKDLTNFFDCWLTGKVIIN